MRRFVTFRVVDDVALLFLLIGVGLLVGSLYVAETATLAVPGAIVLFPSLVYGMR